MSNQYVMNYAIDLNTSNNGFSALWKLTRVMRAAGWTYKASGDGHNKDTSANPAYDTWGNSSSGTTPLSDVYPSTTISDLSDNVASSNGTINVISTAGFPSGGGTFNLYGNGGSIANITYTSLTSTSFLGCTGGSSTVTHIGYTVTLLDAFSAWWCAEGPSTVKIGISAASSGTFLRGEIVTQSTSGATGELLGYVINAAGTSGWLVIMPQTGTFNGTQIIVGDTSGATVTATSYHLIRRQVVFAKNTTVTDGWVFYEALSDTEISASSNTALFSDLAANASGCTASIAPGNSPTVSTTIASGSNNVALPLSGGTIYLTSTTGFPISGTITIGTLNTSVTYTGISGNTLTGCNGGSGTMLTSQTVIENTNNRFPSYGIACIGTAEGGGQTFVGNNHNYGRAQIVATNANTSSGLSADGTFFYVIAETVSGANPGSLKALGLMRLDNTEPGDVDPFAFYCGDTSEYAYQTVGRTQGTTADNQNYVWTSGCYGSSATLTPTTTPMKGYCARTTGTMGIGIDCYSGFTLAAVSNTIASAYSGLMSNAASVVKVRNHPDFATSPPVPIEQFTVQSVLTGATMRKGVCRWLGITTLGNINDTINNKQWLVMCPSNIILSAPTPAVVIGPMDGSTIPVLT